MNRNNALRQGKSRMIEQWKKKIAEIGGFTEIGERVSAPASEVSFMVPVTAPVTVPVTVPVIKSHPKRWDSRTRGKLESEEPICWVDEAATISEEAWAMLARKSPNV